MFICRFCQYQTELLTKHLEHQKQFHQNVNGYKSCGWNHCKKILKTEQSLKMHIFREHKLKFPHTIQQHVSQNLINKHAKFICTVSNFAKEHNRYDLFIDDSKDHLRRGKCVRCPALQCAKFYRNITLFTSHMSRYHSK